MSSPPLVIAFATIEYPPDRFSAGIGSYTKTIAQLLVDRGHRVHVVTRGSGAGSVSDEDGVIVHRLLPGRPELPDSLDAAGVARLVLFGFPGELAYRRNVVRTLHRLIREEGVQIVESSDHMAETLGFRQSRHPSVPFVVRVHTPLSFTEKIAPNIPEVARKAVELAERRLLRSATHLTAPSRVAADGILSELGIERDVVVYPNPPSFDLRPRAERADDAVRDESPVVLFVGRMNRHKGVDLLVQAIPAIVEAHPGTRFVFAGADNIPAAEHPTVGQYLLSLLPADLHGRITFTGHIQHEELERYYREATICVLPSRFEMFPYTCLEAMGFGKAIVGSDSGGMFEMLDGGDAGLLFTPPDVEELQDHVIRLLGDGRLRRDLGERARRRVEDVYGRERVVDQAEEFYRSAIADRNARGSS